MVAMKAQTNGRFAMRFLPRPRRRAAVPVLFSRARRSMLFTASV